MGAMTRITTGMIRRNYETNLTSNMGGLEAARKQVETGRRFEYSYEDPTAAAKAAILEKRYARVKDYISNAEDIQDWQNTQEDAAMAVSGYATTIVKNYNIAAVNGTNALESRMAYATAIEQLQESMVTSLNAKYGETFVFAGNEGKKPPFTLEEAKDAAGNSLGYKELFFRGQRVDDLTVDSPLINEHAYIDLGFGLEITQVAGAGGAMTDQVTSSSAFDAALPGAKIIGYGTTEVELEDGSKVTVSKNLVNLAGQLAKELKNPDFELTDEYRAKWEQFEDTANDLRDEVSILGTKTQLLKSTLERLENEKLNIETQFDSTVNIEPAEAIMNYSWANYAYNSALKVGTSIITPSLLDFIRG